MPVCAARSIKKATTKRGKKKPAKDHFVKIPRDLGGLLGKNSFKITDEEINAAAELSTAGGDGHWDKLTQQLILSSCAFFAQEVLTGPAAKPYNGRFLIAPHHEIWDDLILDHKRIMVEAPRDHGKSFFFDFAYPIWQAVTNPGGCGFIFSASQEQAKIILAEIKSEIETNPKLQYLMPSKKTRKRWSALSIECSNGHKIYARGFGTKVRGAHPNWIVVDDGLNDETAYSEVVRKKQIDYFYSAITNMIIPGGQIIVVGTPFHLADLYADLEKNPEYVFRRFQALDKDENPLWPGRYSRAILRAKRTEIGSIRFTREFQCQPIGDDMSLFPQYLFTGDPIEQYTVKLGMRRSFWEKLGVTIFMGADFALSSSAQADYTVVWVMGIDNHGNRWVIDIVRGRGIGYQAQLSKINELGRKYQPALIFLEANQAQRIFGDELIRTTDLPIKLFTTKASTKNALDKGVPSMRVLLEHRKFRLPRGDQRSIELTNEFIEEMRAFTWADGKLKGVGKHDDMVMACWICDQAIRHGGFKFSFGEQAGDDETDDADDVTTAPATIGQDQRPRPVVEPDDNDWSPDENDWDQEDDDEDNQCLIDDSAFSVHLPHAIDAGHWG